MFMLDALKRFDISSRAGIIITTDGSHYGDAIKCVSRAMRIGMAGQRCLFHILNGLTRKAYDAGKPEELRDALDLVNYMFFLTLRTGE